MPGNTMNGSSEQNSIPVTSVLDRKLELPSEESLDADAEVLVALGYKQEFRRDFSIWRSFGVAFSVLGLLPSIGSTLSFDLGYTGRAGSVWGWLTATVFIQFVALSLAELCSSMPTAGGLYYASAVLAPAGWGPLCAWITGWSNFLGYVLGPLSLNYTMAYMIFAATSINNPGFAPQNYQIWLLTVALIVSQGLLIGTTTKFLGRLNVVGAVINMALVIIFIIWVPAASLNPMNTNHEVWTGIGNGTDWPDGFAFLLGFTTVMYTLAGYDAPFHLSEECANANIASPRAIVMTAQSGMWLGWAIILAIAYTISNIDEVVGSAYGSPLASFCLQVLGKRSGVALLALNIVAQYFVAAGVYLTASRVLFAYSRDGAIVGSRWWKQVNPRTRTPINAVWFIATIDILVGLLIFAGPVAINSVFTIAVTGQYSAFCSPTLLKVLFGKNRFRPGPWNLGPISLPVNIIACSFGALIIPILMFPSVKGSDLSPDTMNWTILLYGGSMFLSLVWYAVDARKWFRGPKINVDLHLQDGADVAPEQIVGPTTQNDGAKTG